AGDVWAAGAGVEFAGNILHRVANRFRVEPADGVTCEQTVVRVGRGELVARLAALPVHGGSENQAVHRLDAPVGSDELRGEEVEQVRMRLLRTGSPEVVGRGDNAGAEVLLPDT